MPAQNERLLEIEQRPARPERVATVVSLSERRALTREVARQRLPSPSLRGRVGDSMLTFGSVALLAMLWPMAKLTGVFAWSDSDERG